MRRAAFWGIPWLVLVAANALAASKSRAPAPSSGPSGFV